MCFVASCSSQLQQTNQTIGLWQHPPPPKQLRKTETLNRTLTAGACGAAPVTQLVFAPYPPPPTPPPPTHTLLPATNKPTPQAAEFSGRVTLEQEEDADIKRAGYAVASSKVTHIADYYDLSGCTHLVMEVGRDGGMCLETGSGSGASQQQQQ